MATTRPSHSGNRLSFSVCSWGRASSWVHSCRRSTGPHRSTGCIRTVAHCRSAMSSRGRCPRSRRPPSGFGFSEAVLHRESVALAEAIPLMPSAQRPVEAHVTAQADEVLGADLFNLLLRYIRPDPFELCFRSALSACAHGSPVTVQVDEACRGGFGRIWSHPFLGFHQSLAKCRPPPRESLIVIKRKVPPPRRPRVAGRALASLRLHEGAKKRRGSFISSAVGFPPYPGGDLGRRGNRDAT